MGCRFESCWDRHFIPLQLKGFLRFRLPSLSGQIVLQPSSYQFKRFQRLVVRSDSLRATRPQHAESRYVREKEPRRGLTAQHVYAAYTSTLA